MPCSCGCVYCTCQEMCVCAECPNPHQYCYRFPSEVCKICNRLYFHRDLASGSKERSFCMCSESGNQCNAPQLESTIEVQRIQSQQASDKKYAEGFVESSICIRTESKMTSVVHEEVSNQKDSFSSIDESISEDKCEFSGSPKKKWANAYKKENAEKYVSEEPLSIPDPSQSQIENISDQEEALDLTKSSQIESIPDQEEALDLTKSSNLSISCTTSMVGQISQNINRGNVSNFDMLPTTTICTPQSSETAVTKDPSTSIRLTAAWTPEQYISGDFSDPIGIKPFFPTTDKTQPSNIPAEQPKSYLQSTSSSSEKSSSIPSSNFLKRKPSDIIHIFSHQKQIKEMHPNAFTDQLGGADKNPMQPTSNPSNVLYPPSSGCDQIQPSSAGYDPLSNVSSASNPGNIPHQFSISYSPVKKPVPRYASQLSAPPSIAPPSIAPPTSNPENTPHQSSMSYSPVKKPFPRYASQPSAPPTSYPGNIPHSSPTASHGYMPRSPSRSVPPSIAPQLHPLSFGPDLMQMSHRPDPTQMPFPVAQPVFVPTQPPNSPAFVTQQSSEHASTNQSFPNYFIQPTSFVNTPERVLLTHLSPLTTMQPSQLPSNLRPIEQHTTLAPYFPTDQSCDTSEPPASRVLHVFDINNPIYPAAQVNFTTQPPEPCESHQLSEQSDISSQSASTKHPTSIHALETKPLLEIERLEPKHLAENFDPASQPSEQPYESSNPLGLSEHEVSFESAYIEIPMFDNSPRTETLGSAIPDSINLTAQSCLNTPSPEKSCESFKHTGQRRISSQSNNSDTVTANNSDTVTASNSDTVTANNSDTVTANNSDTVSANNSDTETANSSDTLTASDPLSTEGRYVQKEV